MAKVLARVAAAAGASAATALAMAGCSATPSQTASPERTIHITGPATTPAVSNSPSRPLGADGTYTGDAIQTPHGMVQVEIVVTNQRITDIHVVQCPSDLQHSIDLCQQATPLLISRSLDAQSANIDSVSGATFTSQGYKQSLQSAIDKAQQ